MTEEEKQIIRDSCCITDEQRKEWNKKIVEDSLTINEEERMTVIKGISNFGTPYYTDEPRYERKNGQWVDTKAGVIAELEKIKEEIEEIKMEKPLMSKGFECYGFKDKTPEDIKTEIIEMLDNHIEELKGENKSEQVDTEFNHELFYEFLLNVINPNEMEKYRSMFLSSGEIVN